MKLLSNINEFLKESVYSIIGLNESGAESSSESGAEFGARSNPVLNLVLYCITINVAFLSHIVLC